MIKISELARLNRELADIRNGEAILKLRREKVKVEIDLLGEENKMEREELDWCDTCESNQMFLVSGSGRKKSCYGCNNTIITRDERVMVQRPNFERVEEEELSVEEMILE